MPDGRHPSRITAQGHGPELPRRRCQRVFLVGEEHFDLIAHPADRDQLELGPGAGDVVQRARQPDQVHADDGEDARYRQQDEEPAPQRPQAETDCRRHRGRAVERYSTIRSARSRTVSGGFTPIAFAVARLTASSSLSGTWIGISAGATPPRTLSTTRAVCAPIRR